MKRLLIAALLGAPLLAHAAAYRCKAADGSLAFQDHPCASGNKAPDYALPSAQGYAPPPAAQLPDAGDAARPGDEHVHAVNDQAKADRCRNAHRTLGVLREQRPVYVRDDNGNRVYLEDQDRPAAVAAAQEIVDSDCP
jgi:hypothetical protein